MSLREWLYVVDAVMLVMLTAVVYLGVRKVRAEVRENKEREDRINLYLRSAPMTKDNRSAWLHLDEADYDERMVSWCAMLEKRVKELDPTYQAYHWGRQS